MDSWKIIDILKEKIRPSFNLTGLLILQEIVSFDSRISNSQNITQPEHLLNVNHFINRSFS